MDSDAVYAGYSCQRCGRYFYFTEGTRTSWLKENKHFCKHCYVASMRPHIYLGFGNLLNDNARLLITDFCCGSPLLERRRMKYQLLRIALVGPTMVLIEQPNCFCRVEDDDNKVLERILCFCYSFNTFCVEDPKHMYYSRQHSEARDTRAASGHLEGLAMAVGRARRAASAAAQAW